MLHESGYFMVSKHVLWDSGYTRGTLGEMGGLLVYYGILGMRGTLGEMGGGLWVFYGILGIGGEL